MMFRLLCRVWFEHEADRRQLPPELNNCPVECVNSDRYYNPHRARYCDTCPHKLERDSFKDHAEREIFEIIGNRARFDFEKTLSLFYQVRNLEDAPREKISVKMAAFLGAYLSEKRRHEAIKDAKPK